MASGTCSTLGAGSVAHDHPLLAESADFDDLAVAGENRLAAGDPRVVDAVEEAHPVADRERQRVGVAAAVGRVENPHILLRLQEKTGAQLVLVGDPKQCQAVEAGPVIDLLRQAVGEAAVPQILTSVRQKTERERRITSLFRAGRAAEALEMKQQDATAMLVAGGREATVQRVARLWRERVEANRADPGYTLTVSAPSNADAREIGAAIRAERRRLGELGEGLVAWRKIQTRPGAPVRLAYGYAMTVDTAQGSTATEHIHALPRGSAAIHGFKAYTAQSRHQRTTWIVIDEASERQRLAARVMLGHKPDIHEPDVWRAIGENLSRQPEKQSALAILRPAAEGQRQEHRRRLRQGAAHI